MRQVLMTTRRLERETVTLERFVSLDAQGVPTYATAVEFEANVVESDGAGKEFVVDQHGSKVLTPLTLYVPGTASVVPAPADRVTLDDARQFIVAERTAPRALRARRDQVDHYRLRCRL